MGLKTRCQLKYILFLSLVMIAISGCGPVNSPEHDLPDQISFNFDIRPILSDNCYVCHGPDSSSRQAGLRLDLRDHAITRLDDGKRAIVPGNWNKSELIHRVSSSDPELMMPPPEMKRPLSEREVALLKAWIEQGANWEPYWAFIPPTDVSAPVIKEQGFINNQIDNFVVDKLESVELTPAPLADKYKLARRLSFVLTGLPPTPDILERFIEDESEQAYENLVEHYLDSPRFGEHWARHWMDLVRYADTRGHEFDYKVEGAWQFRDYLIRSFNDDIPYDQMIREQLAGDLLEAPRYNDQEGFNESEIGTAFYCLSEGKHSPVDLRIDQSERIDNIIDVTSKTFQALTVACSKCHDHKFDPIPTTDYYSMYGMVESTRFTINQIGFDKEKHLVFDSLKSGSKELKSYIGTVLTNLPSETYQAKIERTELQGDHQIISDFRDGTMNGWSSHGVAFSNALGYPIIKNNRIEALESAKVSSKTSGNGVFGILRSPGFFISQDSMLFRAAGKNTLIRVIVDNFQLIQNPIYGQFQTHIKSDKLQDYKIDLSMWKGHHAYIELLVGDYMRRKDKGIHQFDLDEEAWLEVEYIVGFDSTLITRQVTETKSSNKSLDQIVKAWLDNEATPQEVLLLSDWFSVNKPAVDKVGDLKIKQQEYARNLYDTSFVVGVIDGDHIESPVFIRGSLKNLSNYKVPHRFLTALSDTNQVFEPKGSGRLQFANHIADSNNPLTARVMVNRIWHHLFGRGIVETVDNFGVQGKIPSHPKLLDHLATRFVANNWSIKSMIRYMVMSQTFQRSTEASMESTVVDPDNILLQHYPIRRINAESIRDAVLATSGTLDTKMYGPSIPMYLTEFLTGRGRPKKSGPLDGEGRRSVYQAINRNFLPPMMLAFDMPIPFSTFGKRNISNVPSQSLTMLNDPFISNQASHWAKDLLAAPEDFDGRITRVYYKAFSRPPEEADITKARGFFDEQFALLADDLSDKEKELELWKSYCHSVFNMKEFIFLI